MDEIEYFKSPLGMFNLMKEVFVRYYHNPSVIDFLMLVFLLNHLREQIVEGQKCEMIKNIPTSKRTDEQNLFMNLYEMPEFQIIRQLCNGSKHYKIDKQLCEIEGSRCGLSGCGDSLGERYFLIDGEDSRKIFSSVYSKYYSYFNGNNC
jgi:hypothetical protein